jgi:oligoribonuclease (3'-5' exoribonuclease)
MRIVLQRHTIHEAAQHHSLTTPLINTYLDKEAAALVGTVVEVDGAFIISTLGQIGAMLDYPVELHHG